MSVSKPKIGHYIKNQKVAGTSGRSQEVFNPAVGAAKKTVALASADEVNAAVAAAKAAFRAWSKTPLLRRARILDRFKNILNERAEQLAISLAAEHCKTHEDALGEVTRGLEVVEFAVGAPHLLKGEVTENVGTRVDSNSLRQPLGGAKNHAIIMPDADIDMAVNGLMGAGYGSAVERCMAISVAVPVTDAVADALIGKLIPRVEALKIGPTTDKSADMGPKELDSIQNSRRSLRAGHVAARGWNPLSQCRQ